METIIKDINQILAEWNPIGVDEAVATDEYRGYIPKIIKSVYNKRALTDCLTGILIDEMGLDYDFFKASHIADLQQVCEKIMQAYYKT